MNELNDTYCELLSVVLGVKNVKIVHNIDKDDDDYMLGYTTDDGYFEIDKYRFIHMCKEWSKTRKFDGDYCHLYSYTKDPNFMFKYGCSIGNPWVTDCMFNVEWIESFSSDTEFKAVIQASVWVLNNSRK
jgi:hypothetical protein